MTTIVPLVADFNSPEIYLWSSVFTLNFLPSLSMTTIVPLLMDFNSPDKNLGSLTET